MVDDILKRLLLLTSEIPALVREDYFTPLLPALVRFGQTFPPLCSKVTNILVELSRVSSVGGSVSEGPSMKTIATGGGGGNERKKGGVFLTLVQKTFQELVETAIVKL